MLGVGMGGVRRRMIGAACAVVMAAGMILVVPPAVGATRRAPSSPPSSPPPSAECDLHPRARLHLGLSDNKTPVVEVGINGQTVRLVLATSSRFTSLWQADALRLGVALTGDGPRANTFSRTGRKGDLSEGVIHALTFGALVLSDVNVAIIEELAPQTPGSDGGSAKNDAALNGRGEGDRREEGEAHLVIPDAPPVAPAPPIVGGLGADILSQFDEDFDFVEGWLTLYQPEHCKPDEIVGWQGAYSMADMRPVTPVNLEDQLTVTINGRPIDARLQSNLSYSILDQLTAEDLGVTPSPQDVAHPIQSSTLSILFKGVFESVSIGDETIRKVKMMVGDWTRSIREMKARSNRMADYYSPVHLLLGSDFLRSHHVLVSHSQSKLYFSYLHGPAFRTFTPE